MTRDEGEVTLGASPLGPHKLEGRRCQRAGDARWSMVVLGAARVAKRRRGGLR